MKEVPEQNHLEQVNSELKKSEQKKQYILKKAKEVFAERGFKNVTMKDIVDACQISRGGLYLYFDSTEQIFASVLQMEAEEADDVFATGLTEDASVMDVLTLFLKEQKKDILKNKANIDMAVYEYYMGSNIPTKDNYLKKQCESATKVLCKLIEIGVAEGEFYCEDPKGAAENMIYVLQGMRIMAKTVGLSEKALDKQLLYLASNLVVDQE